jgi:hypothetical protein
VDVVFYRYNKGNLRIPVDLDGSYSGSCFIAGGSPVLLQENLSLLDQPGISVLSMNNTASVVPSTMAVFGDKPVCYSSRILKDPKLLKFAIISRKELDVEGTPWMYCPNTYFMGTSENFTVGDLLKPHRDFVWWKNTFYIAIQIAYRLGFRKVYLIGCSFKINIETPYAYGMTLDQKQVNYNNRTYNAALSNMKFLRETFKTAGLEIISATPDSLLNEFYPVVDFRDAVQESLIGFPKDYNIDKCLHSSVLNEKNNTTL